MEKRTYESPVTEAMNIETEGLMVSPSVREVRSTNTGIGFGGGGTGPNRVRNQSRNAWSDGWDE